MTFSADDVADDHGKNAISRRGNELMFSYPVSPAKGTRDFCDRDFGSPYSPGLRIVDIDS
jgi:hypothetical protein